jgi:hypothetical protein
MAATNWKPAHDMAIVYNAVTLKCMSGGESYEQEQFEVTHTENNGAYAFGLGVKRRSVTFELPVDSDTPYIPAVGSFVTVTYSDGGQTVSGDAAITRLSKRGGGRGGYTLSGEATFTGTVTVS